MRKKSWGRLGAAVGVVALLAGGLVGVAAPAQAETVTVECDSWGVGLTQQGAEKKALDGFDNSTEGPSCSEQGFENPRITGSSSDGPQWSATATGTKEFQVEGPGRPDCGEGQRPAVGDGEWVCIPIGSGSECGEDEYLDADLEECVSGKPDVGEPVQVAPPPPPCWDASINNCPVGGALRFTAPEYAMVGVPVTMYAYASWRPDGNAPSQPTNGTAVIRVDGEDYSGVEFVDGVAEWRFIPETEGMKEFTASGVVFSGLSGANAYIDTVPARTYVLEYDPEAYATALKNKRVEVGDTYVITDPNQARSYLEDRYEWSVSEKSDDVCAVYETKKGTVKAKFNGEGKCTVIWMDKESDEEGKYTFIAKK